MQFLIRLIFLANITAMNTPFKKLFAYWMLGAIVLTVITITEENLYFPLADALPALTPHFLSLKYDEKIVWIFNCSKIFHKETGV